MKKFSLILLSLLMLSSAFSQNCYTGPNNITPYPMSTPGFEPPYDSLPCAVQGSYVHDTIYYTNYTTWNGLVLDSLTFDSIGNLPPGLCWTSNTTTNTFNGGESGVIYISGYTNAAAGQYSIKMFITGYLTGGIIVGPNADMNTLAGVYYYMRVACSGSSCMSPDSIGGRTHLFIADTLCSSSFYANISAGGPTTFCIGNSLLLTANTNISGSRYHWSNGDVNQSTTVSATGSYTVTVYNSTDTVISQPVAVVADSCFSSPGGPGFYPPSQDLPCITAGNFVHDTIMFVNYTTIGGLVIDSLVLDSLGNLPAGLVWSTDLPRNTFYSGDTGLIYISGYTSAAAGQYSLGIYIHAALSNGIIIPPGTNLSSVEDIYYYLRVACSNTACTPVDTINGKTNAFIADTACSSPFSIVINGPNAMCATGSVTLTANSISTVSTYSWSDGETTQAITVSPAVSSTYSVTASGIGGTATASINITVYPLPVAMFSITPDSVPHVWDILNQCTGSSLTYTWTWGDGNTTTTTSPTLSHTYDSAAYYTVCVSVVEPLGCSASYCDSAVYLYKDQSGGVIQINVLRYPAGITPVSESTQQISYYAGAVHFSEAVTAPASIRLYDLSGREVMSQDGFTGSVLPVNNTFAQGVYIIHLQNNNYSISRKLPILQ